MPAGQDPAAGFGDAAPALRAGRGGAAFVDQVHGHTGQFGLVAEYGDQPADLLLPQPQVVPAPRLEVENTPGVAPDGHPWHPSAVTQRFRKLVRRSGLPPIRLHDLHHGAATLALDAGVDVKVVQVQLGHSTSTLTRDTYQSVVKQLHHNAADAVAEKIKGKRAKSA